MGHGRPTPCFRHPGRHRRGSRGGDRPAVRSRGLVSRPDECRLQPLPVLELGRGLATRALLLVSRYAASEGGKEAVIRVEPENAASAAVARRAGFTPGTHKHGQDGRRLDWHIRDLRIDTHTQ
ncbi:GNAT family N-acetyltransferase [Streptomyces sp. NBC_01280]|uniref:GNAT family N-acetyltransferase n=1 Tax=Streptomyces sp. NBC_01280 TaxID=2903810 RepID=UPI002E31DA38|nr:GNAT family N-acetyltransferase [Streptomyces sp. NBC_01280]